MTTHILSMTYQPKIEGVRNGTIRQTIRLYNPKRPFKVGEKLLIHGWDGKPYRSSWSWRMKEKVDMVRLCDAFGGWMTEIRQDALWPFHVYRPSLLKIQDCGRHFEFPKGEYDFSWGSCAMYALARDDGIEPPTGEALKSVLERYHGKFTDKPVRFQVIRW